MRSVFIVLCLGFSCFLSAESNLVKTDSPRDTMRTFMSAMNDYRQGRETGDRKALARINDAVQTFNLQGIPTLLAMEKGREAAIYLKEYLDRHIVIDYEKIPDVDPKNKNPILRWRLKGSEVAVVRQESGENAGEYLFTQSTLSNASHFFQQVKDQPYLEGSGQGAGYKEPWSEKYLPTWIQGQTLGLYHWQWVGLFLSIFVGLLIKFIAEALLAVVKRLGKQHQGAWHRKIVEAIEKPVGLLLATLFWFFALHGLRFEGFVRQTLGVVLQISLSMAIVWSAYRLTDVLAEYLQQYAKRSEIELDDSLYAILTKTLRIFILILGTLIALQNLGINVMSVLAGLGLGGLAFALAAKDTAANLFGSLMILWDKPFKVGDWIVSGEHDGTVEEIGFRSTRIRTFYDSQLSIPNAVVANATIDNMGRRSYRRIKATLGLTYDTPPEKMEAFLEGIKNIIKANPHTRKDYYHVVFTGYGASSLDVLLYCFLEVPDWATELVERQNLYLEILRLAKSIGVDFAYPTQSLHVESFPEKKGLREPHEFQKESLKQTAETYGPQGSEAKPSGLGIFVPPYKET